MQRYFTLIELLVVIAILSILAGLLLPALNSARGKARDVQCLNNQKSIGFGLLEYDSQYGCGVDFVIEPEKLRWQAAVIRLVQTQRFDSAENPQYAHLEEINGMWRGWGIYNCPARNYMDTSVLKVHPQNYSLNELIRGKPYKRTRMPSRRILMMDGEVTPGKETGQATVSNSSCGTSDPATGTRISYCHGSGTASIGLFLDGHVSILKRSFLMLCSVNGSSPDFYFWRSPSGSPAEY